MEIDKILVAIGGVGFSVFIYWYFLMYKENIVNIAGNVVNIVVDGGYKPQIVRVKKDQKITLNFERKDPSSCLEEVVIPDFGKKAFLPLNQTTSIEIEPKNIGMYEFACGMNMFHGKIIVE
ncbi:MAG: cupredoxin domain-containing protein [bacterium]|nr:cupredoxin domain-containing protein [bacterium]